MKKIATMINIVINGAICALLDSDKIDIPALAKKYGVTDAQVRQYPADFTQEMLDDGGQIFAGRVRVVSNRGCSSGANPVASLQVQLFPIEGEPPSFMEVIMWMNNPRAQDKGKQEESFRFFRSLKPGQHIFLAGTRKNSPRSRTIVDEFGQNQTITYRNVRITARNLMLVDGWERTVEPSTSSTDESCVDSGAQSQVEEQNAPTSPIQQPRRTTKKLVTA